MNKLSVVLVLIIGITGCNSEDVKATGNNYHTESIEPASNKELDLEQDFKNSIAKYQSQQRKTVSMASGFGKWVAENNIDLSNKEEALIKFREFAFEEYGVDTEVESAKLAKYRDEMFNHSFLDITVDQSELYK
ncbi:hypothetical protein OH460_07615 [Vibrio sp. Makdt]|uniref:hypothetical protein n=1 Tax=Vibrio sp. Makdt TaxID=2998828 RepID=UPI0022CD8FFA|nr:hypothetical protein [Vibrio sp. Makdt]MDA0152165.1 hypothetical protein [Vibrio sp. Makdt]